MSKLDDINEYRKLFDGQLSVADTNEVIEYAQKMETALKGFIGEIKTEGCNALKSYIIFRTILDEFEGVNNETS